MKYAAICGVIILVTSATPLIAQTSPAPASQSDMKALTAEDKAFLTYAAEDNQAEINSCLLAEKKATSPAIRAFARLMVNDHVQIESRLAAVSSLVKFELPNGNGDDGQKTISKLEKLSGRHFEVEFMKDQIEDHSNDLKKFGNEQSSTGAEAVRQYVAETVPILQQHLELAKAVQSSLAADTK